ncbi:MAG TPA: copper-binding protein [Candidatus Binatia bacterium]|nr:copper-binding protein [Candidatus Binatia bacterium]
MRLWRVVVLLNLALGVGFALGYLTWGRDVPRLEAELAEARQRLAPYGTEQIHTAQGVVRTVIREIGVVVLTHEDIPGFMPAMTMGFRAADPALYRDVEVGDVIRFTLRGVPPAMQIVAVERLGKS